MKKLSLIGLLWCLPLASLLAQPTLDRPGFLIDTVYFEFDSYQIPAAYERKLDSLIGVFSAYPTYYIEIFGHTDNVGSDAYNLRLSEERARAIALYLKDQGVSLERVTYIGLGTEKPVADNDSYSGRRLNRRADLSIVFSSETVAPVYEVDSSAYVTTPPVQEEVIPEADTIYCNYNPFNINPARRTVIISPRGMHITVPADAFETDEAEVEMEVKELFDRSDIILAEMPTIDKNGPLEAQGMFSFAARAGRRPLKIRPEARFEVDLPATRRDPYVSVYMGSGGARGGRRNQRNAGPGDQGDPAFAAVKTWNEMNYEVGYKGRDKAYTFEVEAPGRYTIARPLYRSQNTDPEDQGIDITVKFKGRRYERNTIAMVVGEIVRTFIPLRKVSTRIYEATKVKYLDPETRLVLIGIQYDDDGTPWVAKLSFTPERLIQKPKRKGRNQRPTIKIKVKFRKIDQQRLQEMLEELNV
ncbi:MAG: OmpA family protein [Bacteroidetes bacterium]|nr:MAG: OmpA family protein [Bacteroidota bacterium]